MSIWAIIPVKPLSRAKSRLASVLSPQEREQLAEFLFRRVVTVVKSVPAIAGTLVISRDTRVMSIARDLGVNTVQEIGNPELNNALMRATQVVKGWRSEAVLILPADLPMVSAEDVTAILELGADEQSIVIATDLHEDGTNALLIRPPGLIPYTYGEGSFGRHIQAAENVGANVTIYHSDRLTLDIDTPADLEEYYRLTGAKNTFTAGNSYEG